MKDIKIFNLIISIIFAFAVITGGVSCKDDSSDKPAPGINGIVGEWQPVAGVETGGCTDGTQVGGLVLTNPYVITDLGDGTYSITLPNGCESPAADLVDGAFQSPAFTCPDSSYPFDPAQEPVSAVLEVTSLTLTPRDTPFEDEGTLLFSYTVSNADNECNLNLLFTQVTRDTGPEPLETIATFAPGTFIESVERLGSDTWVMAFDYADSGTISGVYKFPDSAGSVSVENVGDYLWCAYAEGFAGNIVFDDAGDLFGTYSNHPPADSTEDKLRQIIQIDTVTSHANDQSGITVLADLTVGDCTDDCSPNGITLDANGNIYMADSSFNSRLFRLPFANRLPAGSGTSEVWAPSEGGLVHRDPSSPQPGANGLKIFEDFLYISNSSTLGMLKIKIDATDGSAETTANGNLVTIAVGQMGVIGDDFAIDVDGNIWVTTHPLNGLVLMRADGTYKLIHDYKDEMWGPTSAVFGTAEGDKTTLYVVTDGNVFGNEWPGYMTQASELKPARVMRIDVGVEGAPVPWVSPTK